MMLHETFIMIVFLDLELLQYWYFYANALDCRGSSLKNVMGAIFDFYPTCSPMHYELMCMLITLIFQNPLAVMHSTMLPRMLPLRKEVSAMWVYFVQDLMLAT